MALKSSDELKSKMKYGRVYRRAELEGYSTAVDRDLSTLVEAGEVSKVGPGLYCRPKDSLFGKLPPEEREVLRAFLHDDEFLALSPDLYNSLGVGLTQVYNETVVYNRKRHEKVTLAGRVFDFRRPRNFPKKLSKEFLLVDLLDNLPRLAEDTSKVKDRVREKAKEVDFDSLLRTAKRYGKLSTRKFLQSLKVNEEAVST
jgi:hypothetical protein